MKSKQKADDKSQGRQLTDHHIIPRSRGGNGNNGYSNILRIPQRFHDSWHRVFGNLTPQEAIKFIETIFWGKGRRKRKITWRIEEIYKLQIALQMETLSENRRKRGRNPK